MGPITSRMGLTRLARWTARLVALAVAALSDNAPAVDDHLAVCGSWHTFTPALVSKTQCPLEVGHMVLDHWDDIETAPDVWNWAVLDQEIEDTINLGLATGVKIYAGFSAPKWLYSNGVPPVMTNGSPRGPYPYYPDPDYDFYIRRMIQKVRDHLMSLPQHDKIAFIQAAFGPWGDAQAWEGVPIDPQYRLTTEKFVSIIEPWAQLYYDCYNDTVPRIIVLYNAGNRYAQVPGFNDFLNANCPGSWRKNGNLNQGFQLNNEINDMAEYYQQIHSRQQGMMTRTRAEQNSSNTGWFKASPTWAQWWIKLYGLHCGLDIAFHQHDELKASAQWPCFEFFNKYAGRKHPFQSPGAFAGLHDGLDASDTVRFPIATYGTAVITNRQRYIKIANAFASRGAGQDDPAAGAGGAMRNRNATGLNDVGWNIVDDNYCCYLYQYDPLGTSIGWWRQGPTSGIHGRFSRGFENSSGKNYMYFNIDDGVFGNQPVNGAYPVTVKAAYHNLGTGTWELRYDSTTGDKQGLLVTKTNTNVWMDATVTLTDAYFGNRCAHGTDFYLHNTDTLDDKFALVDVTKPTAASYNVAPWFPVDPIAKPNGAAGVNYWTSQYQRIDLDAFDPNTEELVFSKVSGPSWLTVSADGDLGGTPGTGDAGLNQFTVRAQDAAGLSDTAVLNVTVSSQAPSSAPTGLIVTPGN